MSIRGNLFSERERCLMKIDSKKSSGGFQGNLTCISTNINESPLVLFFNSFSFSSLVVVEMLGLGGGLFGFAFFFFY